MLPSTSMLAYVPVTRANNGDLLLLSCHDSSSLVKAERGSGEEVSNVHCQAGSKRVKLVGDSGLRCGSAGLLAGVGRNNEFERRDWSAALQE